MIILVAMAILVFLYVATVTAVWTPMDSADANGRKWTQMDAGGRSWTPVDAADADGRRWTPMDAGGCRRRDSGVTYSSIDWIHAATK